MGLIGSLATVFYRINEGIIYSTFLVDLLVTLINFNEYSTNPLKHMFLNICLARVYSRIKMMEKVVGKVTVKQVLFERVRDGGVFVYKIENDDDNYDILFKDFYVAVFVDFRSESFLSSSILSPSKYLKTYV